MANPPDSWEDDLSEQAGNMNMGHDGGHQRGGRGGYRGGRGGGNYNYNPNAQSFIPNAGAPAFVPGGPGGYGYNQGYGNQGYYQQGPGGYPQQGYYQQQPYGGYQQQGGYGRQYNQGGGRQYQNQGPQGPQGQGYSQQQPPAQQPPQKKEPVRLPAPKSPPAPRQAAPDAQAPAAGAAGNATASPKGPRKLPEPKPKVLEPPADSRPKTPASGNPSPAPTPEPDAALGVDDRDKDKSGASTPLPSDSATATPVPSETATFSTGPSQAQLAALAKKKKRVADFHEDMEHLNVVFIGHVDAGKSTIGGQIMKLTGMVDERTLERYEKEAKEANRESWYLSWCMDTNAEERAKGKTVEVGRASFTTGKKRFTILDAPGHKSYVPNMISGASQADVAVLVISARKGEFEAGFDRSGQTREHAMLAKTAGVKFLVVLVNKMDDASVGWDVERYEQIVRDLTPFLRKCGFGPKDVTFVPASGLTGINIKEPMPVGIFDHYQGPPVLTVLEELPTIQRMTDAPVRLPIIDKMKDMGTLVNGKLESGILSKGDPLILMPNKTICEVGELFVEEEEVQTVGSGNNIRVKLKGIEETDVYVGHVLCDVDKPIPVARVFDAQIKLTNVENIVCAGFTCVLHIHSAVEEVKFTMLIALLDKKGKIEKKKPKFVRQDDAVIVRLEVQSGAVCLELFKDYAQLGRFTLRDKGTTIAVGKVVKLVELA